MKTKTEFQKLAESGALFFVIIQATKKGMAFCFVSAENKAQATLGYIQEAHKSKIPIGIFEVVEMDLKNWLYLKECAEEVRFEQVLSGIIDEVNREK